MKSPHQIPAVYIRATFSILILFSLFLSACECASISINDKKNLLEKQATCTSNSDCGQGESCIGGSGLGECTGTDTACGCLPVVLCSVDNPCKSSDSVCLQVVGFEFKFCVTCKDYEEADSTALAVVEVVGKNTCQDGVCFDANLLSHINQEGLVFPTHRRASVMCDAHGSCATSGHIVVFKQKSMMMRSYCEVVGNCSRRVMSVNSPRMGVNVRVPTKTEGLEFTALAAKHGSTTEEVLLSTLVKFGL